MPPRPPMPEPISTPVAHLVLVGLRASSRHRRAPASAAAMAKTMKRSTLRCSLGSIHSSGLNVPSAPSPRGIAAGDLAGEVVDLEVVDRAGAALAGEDAGPGGLDAAAQRRDHAQSGDDDTAHDLHRRCSAVVSTTRLGRQAAFFVEERDGVADGLDRLGGVVRDLDAEFFLERHDELDRVEAVGAQIVDEAGACRRPSPASTPRCSTTIFFTRSAISLIFDFPFTRLARSVVLAGRQDFDTGRGSHGRL